MPLALDFIGLMRTSSNPPQEKGFKLPLFQLGCYFLSFSGLPIKLWFPVPLSSYRRCLLPGQTAQLTGTCKDLAIFTKNAWDASWLSMGLRSLMILCQIEGRQPAIHKDLKRETKSTRVIIINHYCLSFTITKYH